MTKKIYQEPEMSVITLGLDSSVLTGSVQYSYSPEGEDATWGSEYNPW